MQFLRQSGMAILISVVSLGLVVGGLSLALSENVTLPPMATETLWLPTFADFITPTAPLQILPTNTVASTLTNTAPPPTHCTPPSGWIAVVVSPSDNLDIIAQRYKSSAPALTQANCLLTASLIPGSVLYVPPLQQPASPAAAATHIPCGAPYGWARYTVQPGDTLYRISTSYGITTVQLQQANCLGSSTIIRVGQLLWVPNVPTRTPVVTSLPTFAPTQATPTEPLTETPLPFTGTPEPTFTATGLPTGTQPTVP